MGGELRPGIVHRLDKDTSGLLVAAKNDNTHRALTSAWNSDRVVKEYLALVYGTPSPARGRIDAPIGRDPRNRKLMAVVRDGQRAVTEYEVIQPLRYVALVRCRLQTGRTHQIRVHMKHIGHPIVGDPVYSGPQWRGIPDRKLQKVLSGIERRPTRNPATIAHPQRWMMTFESPMPADIEFILAGGRQVGAKDQNEG